MTKFKVLLIAIFVVTGCAADPQTLLNRGVRHYKAGNYDMAISEIKESIDIWPQKNAFHHLGVAYYKKGEYDAAIVQFKKGLERDPENSVGYDWLGVSYKAKKQYEKAVSYFQKAIAKGTTNPWTFVRLADCYNELNQYDAAIKSGMRALQLDFSNDDAHIELAWSFFKTRQHKKAFKAYQKAIELAPKCSAHYHWWGILLMENGDYSGAEEQYKKAVSLKPNNRAYLSRLATVYYRQGKYDEALDATNKAISTMSLTGIGARIQLVENYPVVYSVFESGPAERAGIKKGDAILKIDGKSTTGLKLEEVVSSLRGQEGTRVALTVKRKDSEKSFETTVTRDRTFTAAASTGIGYRSLAQRHKGEKDEALKNAKQAYLLNSSDVWAVLALGASHLDNGRYDEAIKLLTQVKDNATARLLEATAYAKQGDFKKAINIYSAIPEEKLSPKNVPLWSDRTALLKEMKLFITSKMESAGSLKAQGRYKEALIELGDAMKIADDRTSKDICRKILSIMAINPGLSAIPEEARKYALRGDVMTEEGKFEEAVKEYRKAVQVAPYIAKLYFNTAMVYGELKRYPQAIRNMKTYLQLAPEAPNARAAKDQIYKWEFRMEKGDNG